jgi:predicted regulator of Ras-like GTPase activity (Roadblock/LC7/MglB family)
LPPQWFTYIHPEGKEYFYRNSGLRVVTEARMYDRKTADKVCAWATEVEKRAENQEFTFHNNTELFLEIDGNDCSYYIVDRTTAAIFWLTEYTTTELGLKPVVSDSHLSKFRIGSCKFRG